MLRKSLLVPALSLAFGAVGLLPAGVAQASTASLPITGLYQMAVDSAHSHLFLSQGSGGSGVVVTDLSGNQVATVPGTAGSKGLVLSSGGSTVYAAVGSSVIAISTSSLQETTSYSLPAGDSAADLALQSGKLWVSYDNGTPGEAAIGDFDLSVASPTFQTQAAMGGWYAAPQLAADPSDTGVLVAAEPGMSPESVASYDTTVAQVTVRAQSASFTNCDNERDVAVEPGGTQFVLACGWPYEHYRYSTTDLSQTGYYPTNTYPTAVAFDAAGDVAAGTGFPYAPDLYIFHQDSSTSLNSFTLIPPTNASDTLVSRGLAWLPDGSKLFAVVSDYPSGYTLQVIDGPMLTQPTLTLTGPSSSYLAKSVTLTGSITLPSGSVPAGTPITVTRTSTAAPTQTSTVDTTSGGGYTFTDTPPAVGRYTYTASYSGTASIAPATATATVTVSLIGSTLTLTGPSSSYLAKSVTLTGGLSLDSGSVPAGTPITITRTSTAAPTQTSTVHTTSGGGYTFTDTPPAVGRYTYTASYSGTASTAPATASATVAVGLPPAPLTLKVGAGTVTYRPTIHVTAHLGATDTNRTVSIYAQVAGSSSKMLLVTGTVNGSGNLSVTYKAPHSTTFSAVFAGDAGYAATTVTKAVTVRAKVSESLTGYYGHRRIGSTTYWLFHRSGHMHVHVSVAPDKYQQCVDFQVQVHYRGSWQTTGVTPCVNLNTSSKATLNVSLRKASLNYHFRIRANYVSSDATNASNHSAWRYMIFTK